METTVGIATVTGKNHKMNEDRYRLLGGAVPAVRDAGRGHLFGVMDGVGGAPQGMRAAQCIADRLTDFFLKPELHAPTREGLAQLFQATNDEIHAWGCIDGSDRPVGAAAATLLWLAPERKAYVFHCGDTMAYRNDGDVLRQVTTDHSAGRALLRYVGMGPAFRADQLVVSAEPGDRFCLVTDGVTKVMSTGEIGAALDEHLDVKRAAEEVVRRARGKRSPDDITVLVVELDEW